MQIYDDINGNSTVDILNNSTSGIKDYESVSGGFSFTYVSDIFHPSIEFNGKISAGKKLLMVYLYNCFISKCTQINNIVIVLQ